MKKFLYAIAVIGLIPQVIMGGWLKTYGTEKGDGGVFVQQTNDGNYIVVGKKFSGYGEYGQNEYSIWLLKVDAFGDTLWTRDNQDLGTSSFATYVQQTYDGGFIIGATKSLIKTDNEGKVTWIKEYDWTPNCVQQTKDKGYIVAAGGPIVFKTDSLGNTIWVRSYCSGVESYAFTVRETKDGNYAAIGWEARCNFPLYFFVTMFAKFDKNGNITGGHEYKDVFGLDFQQTKDGGYILLGNWCDYSDIWVLKTDSLGDSLWVKSFHGEDRAYGCRIIQTNDGGYLVAGEMKPYDKESSDVWLVKMNKSSDILWTQSFGGMESDGASGVQQTKDNGYIVVGELGPSWVDRSDLLLLKTDSLGLLGVSESVTPPPSPVTPVTPVTHLEIISPIGSTVTLRYTNCPNGLRASVYDAGGRKVDELYASTQSGALSWGSHQSPGVYFIVPQGISTNSVKAVIVR